jgi:hypothetical protein
MNDSMPEIWGQLTRLLAPFGVMVLMAALRFLCAEMQADGRERGQLERERRREEAKRFEEAARAWTEQIRMLLFAQTRQFSAHRQDGSRGMGTGTDSPGSRTSSV